MLSGLFWGAFLAATLFPGGSEPLFLWMVSKGEWAPALLLCVATLGNALGSIVTVAMGRGVIRCYQPKWQQRESTERAMCWLERYGSWALLFSWVPVVGDPLCLAAGWLRLAWRKVVVMLLLAKGLRYLVLLLGWQLFLPVGG